MPTVVILDGSGSMNTADAPGPRIDAAKAAVGRLVDEMADGTEVGLVTYGTQTSSAPQEQSTGCRDVSTLVGLGRLDRDGIHSALAGVKASGYTPIGLSLQRAAGLLPQGDRPQAVVLVSDGEDTCGVPPCEVAGQLKAQRPGLTISTVGFRTGDAASDQLGCIAAVTGGVFVTADNAAQLAARLGAVRDVAAAKAALSSTGIGDIRLGMKATEIVAAHDDFPAVAGSGSVTVEYRDCDFGFVDGMLESISPHGGGRTIDGIGPDSPLVKVVELYGQPLADTENSDDTHTLIFDADPDTDAAYRILAEGYSRTGDTIAGTVKTIILCRCKPKHAAPQENVTIECPASSPDEHALCAAYRRFLAYYFAGDCDGLLSMYHSSTLGWIEKESTPGCGSKDGAELAEGIRSGIAAYEVEKLDIGQRGWADVYDKEVWRDGRPTVFGDGSSLRWCKEDESWKYCPYHPQ